MIFKAVLRCAALGLLWFTGAEALATEAVQVTWPQGWIVRDIPPPPSYAGARLAGSNRVALHMSAGSMQAAISLTSLQMQPHEPRDPSVIIQAMQADQGRAYAARSMTMTCEEPAADRLGALPAVSSRCWVKKDEVPWVEQITMLAVDGDYLHTLGYTGGVVDADITEAVFEAVRESLRFD